MRPTTDELWQQIEDAALFDPSLYAMVTVVRIGRFTREQASMIGVLQLSDANSKLRNRLLEVVNLLPPKIYIPENPEKK